MISFVSKKSLRSKQKNIESSANPKKVLVFGITENPGGVESVIMNYYRHIDREKVQFDFLCNTKDVAYENEIKKLGGKIYRITPRCESKIRFYKDLKKFFSEKSMEYSTIWVNVCSLANIDYLKYAKKYGISKRIIHAHNSQNMDSFFRGMLHKFDKIVLTKYATDFWSCSDDASKWFYNKKIKSSDKYLIVKNAIDINEFKYNESIRNEYRKNLDLDGKLVIGNVGRFHFQKNQIFLVKVFNELQKKEKKSVLLLVGDGEDRENIMNEVKKYQLTDNVIFLGVRNDVQNLMQAMDIFAFTSVFEGLGIVAIEAQVSGLPVIASNKVIPEEVCIDKEIFEFADLDKGEKYWAEKILKLAKKVETRRSKLDLFEEKHYSIEKEVKRVEEKLC